MQVLREEAAGFLRRLQARDAAVRGGKRGEDGAAASAPRVLLRLLPAWLVLESADIFKASFLSSGTTVWALFIFFVSFSDACSRFKT